MPTKHTKYTKRCLGEKWLARPTLVVAQELLGCVLVHCTSDGVTAGRIVEVEAYCGPDDRAAHSAGGRMTARNQVMFGTAGRAYIYLIYGMYHCLNVTTDAPANPHSVLIRALEPLVGIDIMQARSPKIRKVGDLCRGPGRLCRAMGIDLGNNGLAMCESTGLYICAGELRADEVVRNTPRIGLGADAGEDAALPWRFVVMSE